MGRNWTNEQQKVIDLRNCSLLVSAAAGSGKTAVLVERILSLITEGAHPLDIDRLLVVTFTKAAAAEMRERIGEQLTLRIEENPENELLQRQQALLRTATITTIDSFCMQVVREYFHVIHLDPGFRIGDETEMELLRSDVMSELLEELYEEGNEEFLRFAETYADGKTDARLEEYVLGLWRFSESYPWPEEWLKEQDEKFRYDTIDDFLQSDIIHEIEKDTVNVLNAAEQKAHKAQELCFAPEGPLAYSKTISSDIEALEQLRGLEGYERYANALKEFSLVRLSGKPDQSTNERIKDRVRALREEYKKSIKNLTDYYYFQPQEDMLADLKLVRKPMQVLVSIALRFIEKYHEAKEEKNLLDFGDLEHYALAILLEESDGKRIPSRAAADLREKYAQIMIDEYQDSNLVQETLLNAIARGNDQTEPPNVFMVGDVKQSIYRFRLARPELFMEKYEQYNPNEGRCQKIDLHMNFRSRIEVLDAVNTVFEWCMHRDFGRIEYDRNAALFAGPVYQNVQGIDSPYLPELILVGNEDEEDGTGEHDSKRAEAYACVNRIRQLTDQKNGLLITENGKERRAGYGDIVILLRSMKGMAEVVVTVLTEAGIPVRSDTQSGFFEAGEVKTILNYLKILDNPRQDIPLTAVLLSPMVGMTNDELAKIREFDCSIYETLRKHTESEYGGKLKRFIKEYDELRERERYLGTTDLLRTIYQKTGFYELMSAFPAGERRTANLDFLLQQAAMYENTSYHGLFHFIRYIERILEHGIDYGEAVPDTGNQSVRVMSIHRSKGLEFPIVLLPALGKRFNHSDSAVPLVLHPDFGMGPDSIDGELRTKIATLPKQLIKNSLKHEDIAEELRVLYVAMTRAREKIILVGSSKDPVKLMNSCMDGEARMDYLQLGKAGAYLDLIVGAVLHDVSVATEPEMNKEFTVCLPSITTGNDVLWKVLPVSAYTPTPEEAEQNSREAEEKEQLFSLIYRAETKKDSNAAWQGEEMPEYQGLRDCIEFQYPYARSVRRPMKFSVSELKHRAMEAAEQQEPEEGIPMFRSEQAERNKEKDKNVGSERGTLYHEVLERLPINEIRTEQETEEFFELLVKTGKIKEEEKKLLSAAKISSFLNSSLAERMRTAEQKCLLHREQPFVLGLPESVIDFDTGELCCTEKQPKDGEELILIQGIIDLYFEEDGELILADYKTDRANGAELSRRYSEQLRYYAKALEQITGKKVKEKLIYAFHDESVIPIE